MSPGGRPAFKGIYRGLIRGNDSNLVHFHARHSGDVFHPDKLCIPVGGREAHAYRIGGQKGVGERLANLQQSYYWPRLGRTI